MPLVQRVSGAPQVDGEHPGSSLVVWWRFCGERRGVGGGVQDGMKMDGVVMFS